MLTVNAMERKKEVKKQNQPQPQFKVLQNERFEYRPLFAAKDTEAANNPWVIAADQDGFWTPFTASRNIIIDCTRHIRQKYPMARIGPIMGLGQKLQLEGPHTGEWVHRPSIAARGGGAANNPWVIAADQDGFRTPFTAPRNIIIDCIRHIRQKYPMARMGPIMGLNQKLQLKGPHTGKWVHRPSIAARGGDADGDPWVKAADDYGYLTPFTGPEDIIFDCMNYIRKFHPRDDIVLQEFPEDEDEESALLWD